MTLKSRQFRKKIIMIAGPNGAGKTTFAWAFLLQEADCSTFVNADLVAKGLSPFSPEKIAIRAGKIILEQMSRLVQDGENFAFETTLSGRRYVRHIPRWQEAGYHVKLIFLSLPSVSVSLARVRARVIQGGHHIDEDVVTRRFEAGLRNFCEVYRDLVDSWAFYDNSGSSPTLIAMGDHK